MTRFSKIFTVFVLGFALSWAACSNKQKAVTLSEDNRRVGEAYMAKGDYSGALRYFLMAAEHYDKDHLLHDDLGKAYVGKKKYDLAIVHFKKSIELNPEYAPGKNNLGSAYLLAEQWDEAIVVFKELSSNLIYATPQFPLYNLGWAYYKKKDYEKAIDYYNQSLKTQHGFILALRGLGLVHRDMNQPEEALSYFLKAAEKNPRFPQLYMDLGEIYTSLKKYDEAIESYSQVSRIQPNSEISDQAKARVKDLMKLITQ